MGHERAGVEAMYDVNEIIASREPFYSPVSLDTHPVFCVDERPAAIVPEAATLDAELTVTTPTEYIHWAGGALNIPYNMAIVQEATKPGSVTQSFEDRTAEVIPELIQARIIPGVHSDLTSEQGKSVKLNPEGEVGCGYAQKRQPISQLIAERGEEIVADATKLRPELFGNQDDVNFAYDVTAAHGRLAERTGFLTSGRRVVLKAAAKGARVMLVEGEHSSDKGVINLVPGSSIRTDAADKAGLPIYNQDSWALEEAYERVRPTNPDGSHRQKIAELIDGIGTLRALGVKHIAVRRPAEYI